MNGDKDHKKNAKRHPEVFYCKHMYAGLAGYEDETILVDLAAMKAMAKSFEGCPVYVLHQDVELDTIETADGWVSDCFYNEEDGWLWAKFVAVTDEARDAIDKGWSVSNAYIPTKWAGGGSYTNLPYNRQVVDGKFTHLAIVPNPRYESAAIMDVESYETYRSELKAQRELKNSKGKKPMLKLFKNEKKEVTALDDISGVMVDLGNGQSESLETMVNALKKNEDDKKEEKINEETMVEVGEEKMPLKELINKYKNMCKKNQEDEDKEKSNESDEDEKENESDEDEKEKSNEDEKDKEKSNSKPSEHYEQLKNAHNSSKVKFETSQDQLSRGQERYGSGK